MSVTIHIHHSDVITGVMASQITSLAIIHSTVYFVGGGGGGGLHRSPVNSPHKWPVTRKMFPFEDVIILARVIHGCQCLDARIPKATYNRHYQYLAVHVVHNMVKFLCTLFYSVHISLYHGDNLLVSDISWMLSDNKCVDTVHSDGNSVAVNFVYVV